MMSRKWITRLFAATALVLGISAGTAKAGLLPVSVTIQADGSYTQYSYSVVLPANVSLQSGDYFTIYNFAGLVSGSTAVTSTATSPANWSVTSQLGGITPPNLNPTDSLSIPNLTFTYNGPTVTGQVNLGTFTALSTYSTSGPGEFTATTVLTPSGQTDNNITSTFVPTGATGSSTGGSTGGAPPGVPEPTTLALAGLGLPFLGLARRLRRKA